MQAIVTKYIGPTNYRGARVKARTETHTVTLAWDDGMDVEQNHAAAAKALAAKFGWNGTWLSGGSPDTTGYAYVLATRLEFAESISFAFYVAPATEGR